jgi:hypothetical protein
MKGENREQGMNECMNRYNNQQQAKNENGSERENKQTNE